MADEVEKLAGNLTDLNKITLDAGVEFQGLTKRLIKMSDSTSRAGKKWTIFSRIVSGSPIWKIQNKVRAFIDVLAQIEQGAQANAKAAKEQNQRIIDQVKTYETLMPQLEKLDKFVNKPMTHGLSEKDTKTIEDAIKGTLAYNKAILQGKESYEAQSLAVDELIKKGEQQTKVFKEAQKVAKFEMNLKTTEGRGKIRSDLEEERKEIGKGKTIEKFKGMPLRQAPLMSLTAASVTSIYDIFKPSIKFSFSLEKMKEKFAIKSLKFQKGMIGLAKSAKPVLNYAFKVMIMLMLGIMGFLVLAKFIHDSLGILKEMGVINDIMDIGSLVLENVMLIFSMIGALLSGDIYTFLDYALEFVDNLLMIAWDILIVILKGLLALAIATFYTGLDIIHKFFSDEDFRRATLKIAKKALFVFLAAYVVKQIMIQMLTVVAIYALPALVILGLTALLFAVVKKLGDIIKDTFKLDFFANGGVSGGGMAVVGERGPELVNLPKGARVHNNNESKKMGGGVVNNNVSVTINAKDTSDAELRRIAEKIGNLISSKMNRSTSSSGFVR